MSNIVERLTAIVDAENTGGLYREDQAESFVRELDEYLENLPRNVFEDDEVLDELLDLVSMLINGDDWLSGADSDLFNEGFANLAIKYVPDFNEVSNILEDLSDKDASESSIDRGFRDLISSSFVLSELDEYSNDGDIVKVFNNDLNYVVNVNRGAVDDVDVSKMVSLIRVCMHSVNVYFRINNYDVLQFKHQLNDESRDVLLLKQQLNELIDVSGIRRGSLGTLTWPLRAEIRSLCDTARDLENRKWR